MLLLTRPCSPVVSGPGREWVVPRPSAKRRGGSLSAAPHRAGQGGGLLLILEKGGGLSEPSVDQKIKLSRCT